MSGPSLLNAIRIVLPPTRWRVFRKLVDTFLLVCSMRSQRVDLLQVFILLNGLNDPH